MMDLAALKADSIDKEDLPNIHTVAKELANGKHSFALVEALCDLAACLTGHGIGLTYTTDDNGINVVFGERQIPIGFLSDPNTAGAKVDHLSDLLGNLILDALPTTTETP